MQIAKIAVEAATYAIDKPYSYLVPSIWSSVWDAVCWRPLVVATVPAKGSYFHWSRK